MGFYLSQYVVDQGWVDFGIYAQHPVSGIGECSAFYRIFFGQEYCIAAGKSEIGLKVRMMVWKSVRRKGNAQRLQMLEEALRMPDTGNRMIV